LAVGQKAAGFRVVEQHGGLGDLLWSLQARAASVVPSRANDSAGCGAERHSHGTTTSRCAAELGWPRQLIPTNEVSSDLHGGRQAVLR
jgi:hypothetical protein